MSNSRNAGTTISILTIVYNGMPYLRECVESVLAQSHQDWEMLISDDGSNDGSRDYLRSLSDPRIFYYEQEKNLGIFGNLNFLFEKARAPITQILCQDDYFTGRDSLDILDAYWKEAASTTGLVRFNHHPSGNNELLVYQDRVLPSVIPSSSADLCFYIFGNICGNLSNVSLRTALVKDSGYFSQAMPYAGDFEFWNRAARTVDVGLDKRTITHIRRHAGVASNYLNKKGELVRQKRILYNMLYERLVKQFPDAATALRDHGSFVFLLELDIAVKLRLKGNKVYLRNVLDESRQALFSVKGPALWTRFLTSAGGRKGRVSTARKLLSITKHNYEGS